ncbi:regulator of chromosome condensation RCC1 [Desulfatibacillum aliphaticivorans]|uniref:Regulator of chromosome condensation RCC1 n=1 Tax=Desulfatibacillum aliphaticivorans TaxID=218208 RepID=B8FDR4_DESAL|nr:chromosome condensation regulator RCC1 [Desulfatibacillum aliphaticivorans]ACL06695.1 regulator of chromosome condensation RCC1 [Desulfatibacillum aliphaticivorans]
MLKSMLSSEHSLKPVLIPAIVVTILLLGCLACTSSQPRPSEEARTSARHRNAPHPVWGIAAGGGYHSLVVKNDGTVWAWGDNSSGQLGIGTNKASLSPVRVMHKSGAPLNGVLKVAAGERHSLALTAKGEVWTWGDNSKGQLGDGFFYERRSPVKVRHIRTNPLENIVGAACGGKHSLAVASDGTVWAWGSNSDGQIGDGTLKNRQNPRQVMRFGKPLAGVKAVAAGFAHSLALSVDGTVWAWGDNEFGQLGDCSDYDRKAPVQVMHSVDRPLDNVVAIAAGRAFSLALTRDGEVWAWGNNGVGQLGMGPHNGFVRDPLPVRAANGVPLKGVRAITANGRHSLALMNDGSVLAWGAGDRGQLGQGAQNHEDHPTLASLHSVICLAAGRYHSLAVAENGAVLAWGDNQKGQLGIGKADKNFHALPEKTVVSGSPFISR